MEYATRHTQKSYDSTLTQEGFHKGGLGYGVNSFNQAEWLQKYGEFPIVPIGVTDILGNSTGEISYDVVYTDNQTVFKTVTVPRYRGIENPFGHIWKHTDGVHIKLEDNNLNCYVCNNPSKFNDSNNTGWTLLGIISKDSKFIREVKFGSDGDIVCGRTGSSDDEAGLTYFTDKYESSGASGMRVIRFGGATADGVKSGLFAAKAMNPPSHSINSLGTRLVFIPNAD